MNEPPSFRSFADLFRTASAKSGFSADDVREAFEGILAGRWTPVQVGALAIALRLQGETFEHLVAAAGAMRRAMVSVDHDLPLVVDTCGTGGDGAATLNLSTAAAVVVAACGIAIAKHGNRSVSSRCGSADVLEALGVPLDVDPERQAGLLKQVGITFLMAPAHHPALAHAAQARRELGMRTIFNVLGPLCNPARATHQLVGVYDDSLRPMVARALSELGVERAWVVRSEDGLDEVSPSAPTRVTVVREGALEERVVTPEDFGLARIRREDIAGSDAAGNAAILTRILAGKLHPAAPAVVLNAAATLAVVDPESDLRRCASRAEEALRSGDAKRLLDRWCVAATVASQR